MGIRYEQLLPYALPYHHPEHAFRIIAGDFVTTEDGTGIVSRPAKRVRVVL